jgi:crotonobetainyl-CoA:carnitine CoA-transferase CaiB-like acyl-CoA transferase
MNSPLSADFLIVELGERLSAAACGSLLAELGATVVLVEPVRQIHPGSGKSPHRATMAAGKLSVALDPDDSDSVDFILRLIEAADATITSSDLDFQWPSPVKVALARSTSICDVTAFSGAAPHPAMSEGLMQAFTGTMDTTGDPDSGPTLTRAPVLEITAGIYAAAGILLAQRARRQYGLSQPVSISLFDCAMSMMTTFIPRYLMGGKPQRIGNHHASMSPWNAYKASDGWVMVCSGSNDQWKRICTLLDRPELGTDPSFENATARVRSNPEVDRMMEEWMSQHSVSECLERLNAVFIPCGPVSEISQLFTDQSLLYRKMVTLLHDPETNRDVRVPGALFRSSSSRGKSATRIPRVGDDRTAVASLLKSRVAIRQSASGPPKAVLDGLRVIEIGQYTTAPLTARQLGAFGADVVKVEPPGGEPARSLPPHRDGQSVFFTLSNSDKRGIVIDLRKDEDKKLLAEMVKRADVLVENMKPGALTRFGFSPQELAQLNPRLIYCAVSGFGTDSPNSTLGAMDTTIQGMSGIMDLTRSDGTPFKIGLSIADVVGGQLGLTFILAALEERERTGYGQFIDLSMHDAAAWIIRTEWNGNVVPLPAVLPCEDGFVVCEPASGMPDNLTGSLTRSAAIHELSSRGYAAAPVLTLSEALKSREVTAQDIVVSGKSPTGAKWHLLSSPIQLAETPAKVVRAMGPLGCDTDSVLSDWKIDSRV